MLHLFACFFVSLAASTTGELVMWSIVLNVVWLLVTLHSKVDLLEVEHVEGV